MEQKTAIYTLTSELLAKVEDARRQLDGVRLGIIGKPSDWLISSRSPTSAAPNS